jgi:hypothetical protein
MKLSKNFTLEELTATNTNLPNVPNNAQIESIKLLVEHVLQPLRNIYGQPIHVTSGFRSVQVNTRVGGAATSQHTKGEAVDLVCRDNAAIFRLIRDRLPFDQLIWEKGDDMEPDWVHVSFKPYGGRRQVLRYRNGQYEPM